jgi:hypothetical protein
VRCWQDKAGNHRVTIRDCTVLGIFAPACQAKGNLDFELNGWEGVEGFTGAVFCG